MNGSASGLKSEGYLRLRDDIELIMRGDHVLLYDLTPFSSPTVIFILPWEACALLLLSLGEVEATRCAAKIFDLPLKSSIEFVKRVKDKFSKYLEPGKGRIDWGKVEEILKRRPPIHYRLTAPIGLTWLVTPKCHSRCIFCCVESNWQENSGMLSVDQLEGIFLQAKSMGVKTITVSGGEPLLREDLPQILRMLTEEGFRVDLSTRYPLKEHKVKMLAEAGLKAIQISIDSHRSSILSLLSGGRIRSADPYFQAIKELRENGISVHVNIILTHYNIRDVPELAGELLSIGVERITFSRYRRGLNNSDESLFPSLDELKELEEKIGINLDGSDRTICSGGRTHLVLRGDGKVSICDRLCHDRRFILGNLKSRSLKEIWDMLLETSLLSPDRELFKNTPCYECGGFDECRSRGFCYLNSFICHGTPFAPDHLGPMCPSSPVRLM